MSKSVTHKKSLAAWRSSRPVGAARYLRGPARRPGEPRERKARSAWIAATQVRRAVQARIVEAFGRFANGLGPGPTDEELLTFARLAIAEQRLARRLRRSP